MDLNDLYQVVGGSSQEQLEAFVNRQQLTPELRRQVLDKMMNIGHSAAACKTLGMNYLDPLFTPLARAYACFQAGCR